MSKKTWIEKLQSAKPHNVKRLDKNIAGMQAGQMMLLPSPKLVDEFIRTIPSGTIMSIKDIRTQLAEQNHAEVTCPIATGFVMRIVAEAAFEKFNQGASISDITPVWRALDKDSTTIKKLSFDTDFLFQQQALEQKAVG